MHPFAMILIALIQATLSWQLTYMSKFGTEHFVHPWSKYFGAILVVWLVCAALYVTWLALALLLPSLGLAVQYPVTGLLFIYAGMLVGGEMGKRDIHRYFRA